MTNGSLMKVESIADAPLGAFCNTFDLHLAMIGLENQFLVFLRVAVLDRLYCILKVLNTFKGDNSNNTVRQNNVNSLFSERPLSGNILHFVPQDYGLQQ